MNVFVSYRRSDTQHVAGRIVEFLDDTPGIDEVFFDIDDIAPGAEFENQTDSMLLQSDVFLAVIGSDWVAVKEDGSGNRMMDPQDFVRGEIALALTSNVRTIPILVDNAVMPGADELPAEVKPIITRNARFVRHTTFDQDMQVVADAIFGRKPATPLNRYFERHPFLTLALKTLGGLAVSAVTLILIAFLHNQVTGGAALSQTLGSAGAVWLLVGLVFAAGAAIPIWRSLSR